MADKEKVIGHLNDCMEASRRDNTWVFVRKDIVEDALSLLQEQEAVKRTSRKGTNGFSIVWTCGACGSDLHPNNAKAKYCSNCGQAVKW